ncbi:segregation/condensation protein A [Streptomyces sp. DT190]|uniref:segregation and condensation protein A n=1 Tax=unclassified Streptomyces TaxID=2593676 RepID=UPI003CF3932A
MTSNASPPPPGGPAGRRRALGRGPGVPRAEPPGSAEEPVEEPTERVAVEPEPGVPAGPTDAPWAGEPREDTAELPDVPSGGPGAVGPGRSSAPSGEPPAGRSAAGPVTPAAPPREGGSPPRGDASGVAPAAGTVPAADAGNRASAPRPGPGAEAAAGGADADDGVFTVRLANFEGPFDLLLQLISRHKLDVTEVALSKVTDEFMAYIRALGPDWDLDETTEFLVVAATLLDLKAARLLPAAEVEDEADLALLEARDLLFARLLQYRAYKQVADIFSGRLDDEARRYPRTVGLEPHHAELLPEVVISIGAEGFARLAVKAMQPRPKPQVYVDHIHAPLVSVQEQAGIVVARLRELGEASFRTLVADTDDTLTVVARFLALLELYREKAVALEQETALGDLLVRWTGGDGDETPTVTDEFDRPPEPPKEEEKA